MSFPDDLAATKAVGHDRVRRIPVALVLLATVLLFSIAAIVGSQYMLTSRVRTIPLVNQDNIAFSFGQLRSEGQKLTQALLRALYAGSDPDFAEVAQRYEIFVSRALTSQDGVYRALFSSHPFYRHAMAAASDLIALVDGELERSGGRFGPLPAHWALDRLEPFDAAMQQLLVGVSEARAEIEAQRWKEIQGFQLILSGAAVMQLLLTFAFAGLVLSQILRVNRSRDELQEAASRLTTAKAEVEAASLAKSQFLANVSHEIRTPMNGVYGLLGLIAEGPLQADQRLRADTALASCEQLLVIVDDLLDLSKLEAGRLTLTEAGFDVIAAVGGVRDLFAPLAEGRGTILSFDETEVGLRWLHGDVGRIRQVLVNLVGNAIKFTEGGRIDVRVRTEPIGDADAGAMWLVGEVADTGIGISADQHGRIFERFSQCDGTAARRHGGTGLGLAICRDLCTLMGGDITVASEPGLGSRFQFRVRLVRGDEPAATIRVDPLAPLSGEETAEGGPLSLLVVDDVPVNRDLVAAMLERAGHAVRTARGGAEAVAAVREEGFDMVLMDIQMPDMDGLAATAGIRALLGPAATVPVIAVTASAMPGDRERFLALGMDGYVSKPIRRADLLAEIAAVAAARRAHPLPMPVGEEAPGASTAVDPVLDLQQLADLADLIGIDDLERRVERILEGVGRTLELLHASRMAGDGEGMHREAHRLKGMAGNFGLVALAEAARGLEVSARDGVGTDVQVDQLATALRRTRDALRRRAFDAEEAGSKAVGGAVGPHAEKQPMIPGE